MRQCNLTWIDVNRRQFIHDITNQQIPNGIVTYNNTSKEIGFNSSFIPNGPRINLGNNGLYYIDNLGNMVSNKSTSQMICMSPNFTQNINNEFLSGSNVSARLISLSNTGQYQTAAHSDLNGTRGNIYVSSDYGKSWTKKTTYIHDNITSLRPDTIIIFFYNVSIILISLIAHLYLHITTLNKIINTHEKINHLLKLKIK